MATEGLERFLKAQKTDFNTALSEVINGKKQSHWMWYIFPQIQGLGFSETARFYAINNITEAISYFNHPILGSRLLLITAELMKLETSNANQVFGSPDDMKLHSSITLFASVPGADPVFEQALDKFFNGEKDDKTLKIIGL